ncbi:MAG: hypothetical protein ACOX9B_05070 [Candidatus Xenobium sp.]|jgi:hypothetical protein
MRQVPLILLLLVVLALSAMASPGAMVTRLIDAEEVVVNRGVDDQVTPGTRWYIYRGDKPLAELEVHLVDKYSSRARVVQGGGVRVGDRISSEPFGAPPPEVAAEEPAGAEEELEAAMARAQAAGSGSAANRPKPASSRSAAATTPAQDPEKAWQTLLKGATRTADFAGGAQANRQVRVDPLNTINMFTTVGYGGQYWPNIWNIVSVGGSEISRNVSNSGLYKDNKLQIQVTHWSDALLEGYADVMAARENRSSVEDKLAMRASLYAQKGLDRYVVFNVKLINKGPGTVQLSPFHWHMYVLDAQGNRVKAERYDQVLDRTLNPDQWVEGNIYFMKVDVAGRPLLPPGKVKVALEDILGDRGEMSF